MDQAAIIGVVGTLLGTITGAFFVYPITTRLFKKQEFYKAAADFRCAFTEEIRLLNGNKHAANWLEGTAYEIINAAATKHENAVIKFKLYLNEAELARFNTAWEIYRSKENRDAIPDDPFFCYNSSPGDYEGEIEKRKLALDRINSLLEFAKPK